jgi:hypothetical protein
MRFILPIKSNATYGKHSRWMNALAIDNLMIMLDDLMMFCVGD